MSFPIDDFGMNIRAEVKAFNFGFSPAKHLASVIRSGDKVTVLSYTLPNHECFRPNGLGIAPQNVTIIANTQYADQARELKRAYPELRIFLDPYVHCKMTLASSGKVWIGSANIALSNSFDSTVGIESVPVYAFYMEQILQAAAVPIHEQMRANASHDPQIITGKLHGAIHIGKVKRRRKGGQHITIGVHRKDWDDPEYVPAYVEYGHGGPGPAPAHRKAGHHRTKAL